MKVPALSGTTRSNNNLASLFECPVCLDYALPPIIQCERGHIVCNSCRSKLTSCPTCRGPLAFIRNLAMEKVANSVLFPCTYAFSGCHKTLPYNEKVDHEKVCKFRPYPCPCPGTLCKWLGTLEAVVRHLTNEHDHVITLKGEYIIFLATNINLIGGFDWVMMQFCYGFHFMLVLQKQENRNGDQQFFAIVQLIGTRQEAEGFVYRLELRRHRRRLTWEATPLSIHENIATAIKNRDCLNFDTGTVQLFEENGDLSIIVSINMR
ncbi:E3 ubiquitin-protein ligase SIAH1-like [Sapajus apella]|uniref:E3 ubiquitin-protein ligase n=1 Tax=Sapajus apella TaxID=9515 RepID=A0A6J3IGV2_SAPAP|nr:E3 ubiquitin-protein ligase SIAH1-like [Sapajus apella]